MAESEQDDNAVLGAILGSMIAFDQGITNTLIDSHIDSAIEWATKFRTLYDYVSVYNRDIVVKEGLDHFYWDRENLENTLEHLRSMKMGDRS